MEDFSILRCGNLNEHGIMDRLTIVYNGNSCYAQNVHYRDWAVAAGQYGT